MKPTNGRFWAFPVLVDAEGKGRSDRVKTSRNRCYWGGGGGGLSKRREKGTSDPKKKRRRRRVATCITRKPSETGL